MAQETEAKLRLTAQDQTAAAFQSAGRHMRQLQHDVEQFGHRMPGVFRGAEAAVEHFGQHMGKYLGAAALEEFTRHAFMAGAEIERSFTRMGIGLGIPREKVQELREEIEKLSVKTGISAKDLRDGFNLMARDTRLSLHEVEHIFPRIAEGAKVAGVTSSQMAEVIASALRNFKVPAGDIEKVIDDLVVGAKGNLSELVEAFPKLSTIMGQMGYSGEEGVKRLVAILMTMKTQLGSTGAASSALSQILEKMWSPELDEKLRRMPGGYANLRQELERVQKSGGDVLAAFIGILRTTGILTDEKRLLQLFDRRTAAGAQAFANSMGEVERRLKEMGFSTSATKRALKELADDSQDPIDRLKTSFEQLETTFFHLMQAVGANTILEGAIISMENFISLIDDVKRALNFLKNMMATTPLTPEMKQELVEMLERKIALAKQNIERVSRTGGSPQQIAVLQERLAQLEEELKRALADAKTTPVAPKPEHPPEPKKPSLLEEIEKLGPDFKPGETWPPQSPLRRYFQGRPDWPIEMMPGAPKPPAAPPAPAPQAERHGALLGVPDQQAQRVALIIGREAGLTIVRELEREDKTIPAAAMPVSGTWPPGITKAMFGGGAPGEPGGAVGQGPGGTTPGIGAGPPSAPGGPTAQPTAPTGEGPATPPVAPPTDEAPAPDGAKPVAGPPTEGGVYNYFQKHGQKGPMAESQLQTVKTPFGNIKVHKEAAADFAGWANELAAAGAPIKKFGSFNPRKMRWSNQWSSHAMGAALDIDDATALSPAMRAWILANPEKWKEIGRRWNIGQPLTDKSMTGGKDAPHVEWKGPHGTKWEDGKPVAGGPPATPATPGAPAPQIPTIGPETTTRATWFHTGAPYQAKPGAPVWSDVQGRKEGLPASGLHPNVPGIATPGNVGLREWYQVTLPDGRVVITQKTDKGPGKGPVSKGIALDINAALAAQLYPGGPSTFPSGAGGFKVTRIGKTLPAGVTPGIQTPRAVATPPAAPAAPAAAPPATLPTTTQPGAPPPMVGLPEAVQPTTAPAAPPGTMMPQLPPAAMPAAAPPAVPGVTAPPAAAAPGGSRVVEAQGKVADVRKLPIDPRLKEALEYAAAQTGTRVRVTSGGQPEPGHGRRTGSLRHDLGKAADFDLIDEKGNIIPRNDPRRLAFLEEAARAGAGGTGTGYMSDPLKIHAGITGKTGRVGEGLGPYAGSREEQAAVIRGLRRRLTPEEFARERARQRGAAPRIEVPKAKATPVEPAKAAPSVEPERRIDDEVPTPKVDQGARPAEPKAKEAPSAEPERRRDDEIRTASLDQYHKLREDLERPIKMAIEAPDIPSQLVPQFRRASARTETNREFREARWASYSDIGAA